MTSVKLVVAAEAPSTDLTSIFLMITSLIIAPFSTVITISLRISETTEFFLIPLCVSCVIEATVNSLIASLFHASWADLANDLGSKLGMICCFNAALNILPPVLQSYSIAMLAWNQRRAFHHINDRRAFPQKLSFASRAVIVFFDLVPMIILIPIFASVTDCRFFPQRYYCGCHDVFQSPGALFSVIAVISLGHAVPLLITLFSWIVIIFKYCQIRNKIRHIHLVALHRAANNQSPMREKTSLALIDSFSYANIDNRVFQLTAYLTVLFITLVLPSVVILTMSQFHLNWELTIAHNLFINNTTTSMPDNLKTIITPSYESVFTWLRLFYSFSAAALIVYFLPEVSYRCKTLFKCRDFPERRLKRFVQVIPRSRIKRHARKNIPVLFVTSEGLFLRASDNATAVYADGSNMRPGRGRPLSKKFTSRHLDRRVDKSVRFSQRVNEIPINETASVILTHATVNEFPSLKTIGNTVLPSAQSAYTTTCSIQKGNSSDNMLFSRGTKNTNSMIPKDVSAMKDFTNLGEINQNSNNTLNSSSSLLLSFEERLRFRD